jgi:hypothetical protein
VAEAITDVGFTAELVHEVQTDTINIDIKGMTCKRFSMCAPQIRFFFFLVCRVSVFDSQACCESSNVVY